MKKFKKLSALFIASTLVFGSVAPTTLVDAHSGRTDAQGGHKDNKNVSGLGSYHYHHGYSAHLHKNGKCPYKKTTVKKTTTKKASTKKKSTKKASTKKATTKSSVKKTSVKKK